MDPPQHADTPADLIAWKEMLGDHARDVVEESLLAARDLDPDRYRRMVSDKLAPVARVGPGLVKALCKLAEDLRHSKVEPSAAAERVTRQLPGFALDADALIADLMACADRDAVRARLTALTPQEVEIEPGKELARLFADFLGQEVTAMQRELFGSAESLAKLVYELTDSAHPLEINLELTKRKAHAAIGLCEGVCVATDDALWSRPEFFQVIFRGPDDIAAGERSRGIQQS
ncbi:MAG: hypothetical protein AAGG01_14875 [Planctomycetota bacterium]